MKWPFLLWRSVGGSTRVGRASASDSARERQQHVVSDGYNRSLRASHRIRHLLSRQTTSSATKMQPPDGAFNGRRPDDDDGNSILGTIQTHRRIPWKYFNLFVHQFPSCWPGERHKTMLRHRSSATSQVVFLLLGRPFHILLQMNKSSS